MELTLLLQIYLGKEQFKFKSPIAQCCSFSLKSLGCNVFNDCYAENQHRFQLNKIPDPLKTKMICSNTVQ